MWSHSYAQNVSACLTWHLFAAFYRKQPKCFAFDHCFYSVDTTTEQFANQEVVFDCLGRDILVNAFQGYNACIFAYGQTGECFSWFSTRLGGEKKKLCVLRFWCPQSEFSRLWNRMSRKNIYWPSHGIGVWSIRYSEEIKRLCEYVTLSAFLRPNGTGHTVKLLIHVFPKKVVRRTFRRSRRLGKPTGVGFL